MVLANSTVSTLRSSSTAAAQWIIKGGLLVGLVLAVFQCSIERQNTREATVQTYNMGRAAAFRDSGAELDKKIAAFNDAAAEGRDLTEFRQAIRGALADHAAKTMAMGDAFGKDATQTYTSDLKVLQDAIEGTRDSTNSGPILSAMSRVVIERNRLADNVTMKATG
jgi:hypothetical protein